MPKNSYEDTYPWTIADKWGITLSPETVRWATRAWDEGLVECKTDCENLKDFNSTLKSLYKKLGGTDDEAAASSAAAQGRGGAQQPQPGSTQNRVPKKNYEALWEAGDAITEKCKIWVGTAGGEPGKLGALCRRFLYM